MKNPPQPATSNLPPAAAAISLAFVLIFILLAASSASARIWLVNPIGTADAPTPQAAMDSAQAGDEVVLTPGTYTYKGYGVFMKSGVVLRSQSGPETTIMDAQRQGSPVLCYNTGPGTRIEGLTLRDASGADNHPQLLIGAGIYCKLSIVEINNCILIGNSMPAGIYGQNCQLLIEDCKVLSNRGPGILHDFTPIGTGIVVRRTIVADSFSGSERAGFSASRGSILVENSLFIRNYVGVGTDSEAQIRHNTIVESEYGLAYGGVMSANIQYNIIAGGQDGIQCTAPNAGPVVFACNDVWSTRRNYTGCADQTGINGNISADPLFCDTSASDYDLTAGSPAATAICGLMGSQPVGCGPTSARAASWGWIKATYR